MEKKKKSSIFDLLEGYMEGMTEEMKRVPLPVEEMLARLEEEIPEALRDFVTEEETQEGKARIYGPFIYGLSYTKEPGKEPEIKELGNIKPSHERIAPAPKCESEPLIDVIDYKDTYEVVVELPDVEKSDIKLDVTEESLDIKTGDGQRFSKEIPFDMPVTPATAKATYKNGVLCVTIKKEKGEKKKTAISLE
nr:conserved hypothetical protein, Hsp20/alpha crystallin family [uncultured archaeon]